MGCRLPHGSRSRNGSGLQCQVTLLSTQILAAAKEGTLIFWSGSMETDIPSSVQLWTWSSKCRIIPWINWPDGPDDCSTSHETQQRPQVIGLVNPMSLSAKKTFLKAKKFLYTEILKGRHRRRVRIPIPLTEHRVHWKIPHCLSLGCRTLPTIPALLCFLAGEGQRISPRFLNYADETTWFFGSLRVLFSAVSA